MILFSFPLLLLLLLFVFISLFCFVPVTCKLYCAVVFSCEKVFIQNLLSRIWFVLGWCDRPSCYDRAATFELCSHGVRVWLTFAGTYTWRSQNGDGAGECEILLTFVTTAAVLCASCTCVLLCVTGTWQPRNEGGLLGGHRSGSTWRCREPAERGLAASSAQ